MSEYEAPFILKISFNMPTSKGKASSAAHVKYIGTRPGVAFENDLDLEENGDVKDYSQSIDVNEPNVEDYAKYIDERPRSHGLFTQEDTDISLTEVQSELSNHQGVVWKMILSLKEEDAIKLGYTNRNNWEDMLRSTVPDVVSKMGIKQSNMRWVAAFHEEKGHPHVHLMVWEKDPIRERGILSKGERMDIRRCFVNEIFETERVHLYQEKTAERDLIRDLLKDDISQRARLLKGVENEIQNVKDELAAAGSVENKITPRVNQRISGLINGELSRLSEMMPGKGRISFKFMPDAVKQESLRIANTILQSPELHSHINNFLRYTEELTRHHATNEDIILKSRKNAYEDLKKRVAQVVLKGAAEINKHNFMEVDSKKIHRVIRDFTSPNRKPIQDLNSDVLYKVVKDFRAHEFKLEDVKSVLGKWTTVAELSKNKDEMNDIVERAYSDPLDLQEDKTDIGNIMKIMRVSGYEKEEIFNKVGESTPLEDKEQLYKANEKFYRKINNIFITNKEWTTLEKGLHLKSDYPYDLKVSTELKTNMSVLKSMLSESRLALNDYELSTEEYNRIGGWTAFCINVALKQSGVETEERGKIVNNWIEANNIQADFAKMDEPIKDGSQFLKKKTWERLSSNLNLENADYPWITIEDWEFNAKKANQALNVISEKLESLSQDNKSSITTTIFKIQKNLSEDSQEFQGKMFDMNQKFPEEIKYDQEELKGAFDNLQKRKRDVESFSKIYDVRDIVGKTTLDYAKLLYSLNVSDNEVRSIIGNWNLKTNLGYTEEKLDSIIDKASKIYQENSLWGKTTFLKKDDFKELCRNLGIRSVYPYKHVNAPVMPTKIFKTVWKTIERSNKQNEAQVKIKQKKIKRDHAIEQGKIKEFIQEEELER